MLPSTETFAVPELLEMILEHARHQDLLLWQRVNKTWHAAIQQSPRILEKLHFRNQPCKDKHEQKSVSWNPLMESFSRTLSIYSCEVPKDAFANACYPTASWKQMFVTSPAVTELRMHLVLLSRTGHLQGKVLDGDRILGKVKQIACETGITIGQIADAQKRELTNYADHSPFDVLKIEFFFLLS